MSEYQYSDIIFEIKGKIGVIKVRIENLDSLLNADMPLKVRSA